MHTRTTHIIATEKTHTHTHTHLRAHPPRHTHTFTHSHDIKNYTRRTRYLCCGCTKPTLCQSGLKGARFASHFFPNRLTHSHLFVGSPVATAEAAAAASYSRVRAAIYSLHPFKSPPRPPQTRGPLSPLCCQEHLLRAGYNTETSALTWTEYIPARNCVRLCQTLSNASEKKNLHFALSLFWF